MADCHYALGDYDALWKLGQAVAAELGVAAGAMGGMGSATAMIANRNANGEDALHADAKSNKKLLATIAGRLVSVGLGEQG